MIPMQFDKIAETLTGGGAGPATSGPAHQDSGHMFNNGGLSINKPNYAIWAVVGIGLIVAYELFAKKK